MNVETKIKQSCDIMNLKIPFTKKNLKKRYYELSLKHHPDKNNSDGTEFKEMYEAYRFLDDNYDLTVDNKGSDSKFNITPELYNILINKCIESLNKAISKMNKNNFIIFYETIKKVALEQYIAQEILDIIDLHAKKYFNVSDASDSSNNILPKDLANKKIIIITPSIKDLFEHNIFIYKYDESCHDGNSSSGDGENTDSNKTSSCDFYIPLWHHEIHFKTKQNKNVIFKCIPEINQNYFIDDDNNLHIHIVKSISELFSLEYLNVYVYDNLTLTVNVSELFIREHQIKILKNKGFAKINTKDNFNIQNKANIVLHINLHK